MTRPFPTRYWRLIDAAISLGGWNGRWLLWQAERLRLRNHRRLLGSEGCVTE